ncbi:hypothetical protein K458DRAFT_450259 [Lentithecium fluviatile CBS 122367]|uniref:Uncharacterized protein n=1 Tax=Lentithecium fluviatile CBS 122367 TaxID=1168545 RepID=A0A6G1J448_9PLEO|nr:hypothetical protein K458DRAFT_450259 [Lentithecium fluviatile CBS 122367]
MRAEPVVKRGIYRFGLMGGFGERYRGRGIDFERDLIGREMFARDEECDARVVGAMRRGTLWDHKHPIFQCEETNGSLRDPAGKVSAVKNVISNSSFGCRANPKRAYGFSRSAVVGNVRLMILRRKISHEDMLLLEIVKRPLSTVYALSAQYEDKTPLAASLSHSGKAYPISREDAVDM